MGLYLLSCDYLKSGKKAVNDETLIPVFIILSVWLRTSFPPTSEVGAVAVVLKGRAGGTGKKIVRYCVDITYF